MRRGLDLIEREYPLLEEGKHKPLIGEFSSPSQNVR